MRTISGALKTEFLNGFRAIIVKIIPKTGPVYGYTDHDFPITSDITYAPAPGLKRLQLNSSVDDTVSNQEFASAWVDAPEQDMLAGKFDDAEVIVSFISWNNPGLGSFVIEKGNLGAIQWTADGFRADVQSHMRRLRRNISFIFTSGCRHQLFSQFSSDKIGACTVGAGSFTFSGTTSVEIVPRMKWRVTGLSQPAGYFNNGVLTFTSGLISGTRHEVKLHSVGANTEIELFVPVDNLSFVGAASVGVTISVAAGCDKTLSTCKAKFNNVINFGGFPHIQPEIQYR